MAHFLDIEAPFYAAEQHELASIFSFGRKSRVRRWLEERVQHSSMLMFSLTETGEGGFVRF